MRWPNGITETFIDVTSDKTSRIFKQATSQHAIRESSAPRVLWGAQ